MLFVNEDWVGPCLTHIIIPGAHSCRIIIARGEKWGKKKLYVYNIKWKRNSRHRQNWSVRDVHSEKKKKFKRRLLSIYYTCRHPYVSFCPFFIGNYVQPLRHTVLVFFFFFENAIRNVHNCISGIIFNK